MKKDYKKRKLNKLKLFSKRTSGQKMSDVASEAIGSWWYIGVQTFFIAGWISINYYGYYNKWDPYPFILLNLALSTVATYAAPIILMSQNRAAERDRARVINDLATDRRVERRIIELQKSVDRIERKLLKK